ncbi:MAG TPA: response regulator transcription factor [Bacteroidota bacterium]|nr:response regulator transcription factor [Bacteroidota bacterium]
MAELDLKILLVDDLDAMRSLVRLFLRRHSSVEVVAEAANGEQAIELCRQHRPDVVLCDISLPGSSGVDVGKHLKQIYPSMRVYLYSAFEMSEYRELQHNSPVDGFIQKSALKNELAAMIERELERKKIS